LAVKTEVPSSTSDLVKPKATGTSLLLRSLRVKSVETVALAWPEPSLAVTRRLRSVALAGGLPLNVRVAWKKASQAGSGLPSARVAE
jgi:hypothetical protein